MALSFTSFAFTSLNSSLPSSARVRLNSSHVFIENTCTPCNPVAAASRIFSVSSSLSVSMSASFHPFNSHWSCSGTGAVVFNLGPVISGPGFSTGRVPDAPGVEFTLGTKPEEFCWVLPVGRSGSELVLPSDL
uniref:Uncharacterized protein n=1 Tax=Cacopsylla melanoneura TaxID=428564 RepID=A0A8D8UF56_9HEMI